MVGHRSGREPPRHLGTEHQHRAPPSATTGASGQVVGSRRLGDRLGHLRDGAVKEPPARQWPGGSARRCAGLLRGETVAAGAPGPSAFGAGGGEGVGNRGTQRRVALEVAGPWCGNFGSTRARQLRTAVGEGAEVVCAAPPTCPPCAGRAGPCCRRRRDTSCQISTVRRRPSHQRAARRVQSRTTEECLVRGPTLRTRPARSESWCSAAATPAPAGADERQLARSSRRRRRRGGHCESQSGPVPRSRACACTAGCWR